MSQPSTFHRRTILAGVTAAAVAPGPLVPRARSQTAPTKVTFGWPFAGSENLVTDLAKRFTEAKPSIEVEVQVIPQAQVIPKLTTAFIAGSAPDCMGMSDAWLAQFATPGWLDKLDDRLAASGLEQDLAPASMAISRMLKNTAYYAGMGLEAFTVFYNRKLFAEAGLSAPPADIDQFRGDALKLTDAGHNRFGYYALGGSGWQFQQWSSWMIDHGGVGVDRTLYDAAGKCVLDGPKHVEGLQKWLALYQQDKVSPPASATATFQDQGNAFKAGQVAMIMGWSSSAGDLAAAVGEDTLGVAMPPAGPAGQFFYFGGNGYCINSASKNKDAAWEFIRFVLQPDNNAQFNAHLGAVPANTKAWGADWLKKPSYDAQLAMLKRTGSLVNNPRYLPGYASFQVQFSAEQIQKALLGRQTPQQFADAIAGALNDLRAKAT